ncbi:hypothetical protein DC498_20660 [Terrimonas sp.]|uniref:hypothetical protein n=1 Tax=Terrimonas sp. TaxID=1914338 RepID=UPI000D508239|nr:hypothetical protein [Terrimonas sp.]PVD50258.1 hypothetical protein DC498_20660 [Terrimonas sp.]
MLRCKPFACITLLLLLTAAGCKKDSNNENGLLLKLTPDNVTGKSGRIVEATLSITSATPVKSIVIYKTINLKRDNTFGGSGTETVSPVSTGTDTYEYKFTYQLLGEEVDKLVGFNFHVENNNGSAAEKDLTVNTTTSGQQIMYSRKWKLISRMWISVTPPAEDMKECEKDDVYSWNEDSTYNINFGSNACTFDGFNVFDRWELSEDEKTLTQVYHSLFDPAAITTETYTVKTLTSTKIVMSQLIDLTVFGLTDHEEFESTFEPAP